jgi:phospholipid/cholesterol/gamma-HCH transport system permease protein
MTEQETEREPVAKPARSGNLGAVLGRNVVQTPLRQAGEMAEFACRVVGMAVRHPVGYWGAVRDEMAQILKLCWLPMIVSTTMFGFGAPGLQGGNILYLFGVPDRLGSFFIMASVREFAPWINAMIIAGVVGTAMTADLGARRIREEIDAMEVLGIDPVRTLVLPRVVAVTIMTGLLDIVALAFGVVGGFIASVYVFGTQPAAFLNNFFDNATTPDIWGSVLKTTIFGFIIAIVCCYKGMNVAGGPAGVGRSVNQAVVISFSAIWVVNWVFTTTLLGLNPEMLVYK